MRALPVVLALAAAIFQTALAAGIRTGFLCGAIISLFAIVVAFFVKKPPANPEMAGMGH